MYCRGSNKAVLQQQDSNLIHKLQALLRLTLTKPTC